MTKLITAREATVKTATVELKTLTVSGKAVTLSVYRQLKDEAILDSETAQLAGDPWGIVNYFPGECAKVSEHLHVVWQKGDQLRRSCVYPEPQITRGWMDLWGKFDALCGHYTEAKMLRDPEGHGIRMPKRGWARVHWKDGYRCDIELNSDVVKLLEWRDLDYEPTTEVWRHKTRAGNYLPSERIPLSEATEEELASVKRRDSEAWERVLQRRQERVELVAEITEDLEIWVGTSDAKEIFALADAACDDLKVFEKRWRDQYAALAELDHLFIAV